MADRIRTLFILFLILAGGMYVRAEGLWESEISHEDHYGHEAPFVLSNYYFFWKYHTHPGDPDRYIGDIEKYSTRDYRIQGIFPVFHQGHPTLFPLILSLFPHRVEYYLKDPNVANFLNKTADGYVLIDTGGPAGIEIIKTYEDGSILFLSNSGDARVVSVLFGTLMILVVFVASKALYNIKTAYLSSAIVAFAPPVINMVRLSDNESVMVVFLFIATLFYLKAFETDRYNFFIFAGLFHGLAMGTKFTAFALFPIVVTYMAITKTRDLRVMHAFIISFIVLSMFSHPGSAIQEVVHPSELKIGSVSGYIDGLNPYPLLLTMLIFLFLFISRYPISSTEKMLMIYLSFFSLMPFLESYRQYILVPPAAIIISAVGSRILFPRDYRSPQSP